MEVKLHPRPIKFEPFTVEIKFETQDEAQSWANMLSYNLSIPEEIMKLRGESAEKLTREMSKVQEHILSGIYGERS